MRPDILTAAAFLVTRVKGPTVQDEVKLNRMLAYLNATQEMSIRLGCDGIGPMTVTGNVDASYGVHWDLKGHTGCMIHISSRKQGLTTKSSTEAELVEISDTLTQVIWTREFLLAQGYNLGPAVVKQDNQSTIVLAGRLHRILAISGSDTDTYRSMIG